MSDLMKMDFSEVEARVIGHAITGQHAGDFNIHDAEEAMYASLGVPKDMLYGESPTSSSLTQFKMMQAAEKAMHSYLLARFNGKGKTPSKKLCFVNLPKKPRDIA